MVESEPTFEFNKEFIDESDESIQTKIFGTLQSTEFHDVLKNESIGGNAGQNNSAVNALCRPETGEILYFGNEGYKEQFDFKVVPISFIYNHGSFFAELQGLVQPEDHVPASMELFVQSANTAEMSDRAMENLRIAVEQINEKLKEK